MTKLMRWLLGGFIILGVWIAIIKGQEEPFENIVWYYKWFPFILVALFGIYSVTVILYRVFTFNNCEEAAIELQKEIKEARADLISKGIRLKQTE